MLVASLDDGIDVGFRRPWWPVEGGEMESGVAAPDASDGLAHTEGKYFVSGKLASDHRRLNQRERRRRLEGRYGIGKSYRSDNTMRRVRSSCRNLFSESRPKCLTRR